MAPPAPGLLSTTTGTPICLLSASAISRMLMSLPPPAGHATINVIGSEGNVCACEPGEPATVSPATMAAHVRRALRFISRLPRKRPWSEFARSDSAFTCVVSKAARCRITERVSASHPARPTMADQQKLCHEFSHDIEREQTVFAAAEQAEDRLVYSGFDEILQPLGAMLRGSRDAESLAPFVGAQRWGASDIAARGGGGRRRPGAANPRRRAVCREG